MHEMFLDISNLEHPKARYKVSQVGAIFCFFSRKYLIKRVKSVLWLCDTQKMWKNTKKVGWHKTSTGAWQKKREIKTEKNKLKKCPPGWGTFFGCINCSNEINEVPSDVAGLSRRMWRNSWRKGGTWGTRWGAPWWFHTVKTVRFLH